MKTKLSGNEAVSNAMRQINPDVVAAFPITPSTEIPEYYSKYVADGLVDTEFVAVESEHSAMSASIGASLSGARAMTATSSNGLAYMWEMLHIASGLRAPIVMQLVTRAISAPLNIHNDHSDAMGMRDTGWIMLFSENNQEAYDNTLIATRLAEHEDVLLPVAVCQDGFITSHAIQNIDILEDEEVKKFVGEFNPKRTLLNRENPITMGATDLQDYLFEHRKQQEIAMKKAKEVLKELDEEYYKLTGRKMEYIEKYMLDDAEYAIVVLGSTAGTAKVVVDEMRKEGKKVGLVKIRMLRPFPGYEIAKALENLKAVAILDKVTSFSTAGGPMYTEVTSAMKTNSSNVIAINYTYGIGGRDVKKEEIEKVYNDLIELEGQKKIQIFRDLGLRSGKED